MINENSEINNIPQPDPSWDYYILWHSLHHIKAKIDAALGIMMREEYANTGIDIEIKNHLDPASEKLIDIINSLPDDDENEE
jgi:hypothetical protein